MATKRSGIGRYSSHSLWDHQLLPQQLSSESRRSYLWGFEMKYAHSLGWKLRLEGIIFFVKISLERNYSFWVNSSGSDKCPPRLSQSQEMQWGVQVGIFSNIPLHHVGILQDWIVQEAEVVCWTEVPGVFYIIFISVSSYWTALVTLDWWTRWTDSKGSQQTWLGILEIKDIFPSYQPSWIFWWSF